MSESAANKPLSPRERGWGEGTAESRPSSISGPSTSPASAPPTYAARLLAWHARHGRHDLPWQHPRSPYRVWLSEIMLQQTQVATAAPYFERFIAALPELPALAAAPLDRVLALWSGLGYYSRARNLHAAAGICAERHDGTLPRDAAALLALPGIGRSTAAAILSQAWGERAAILDGNVKRVLARHHGIEGWPGSPAVEKQLWRFAERHVDDPALPATRLPDYTQAQMDLGATICTRARPACVLCPLQDDCIARIEGRTAELPTRKPSRTTPQRHARVLWLCDSDGRMLLQRRPPTGVWASLWSLPQADHDDDARDWFARHVRGDFGRGEALPPIDHAFSHYKLQLQPYRWNGVALRDAVHDRDELRWVAPAELEALGIPAPIRKLLASP